MSWTASPRHRRPRGIARHARLAAAWGIALALLLPRALVAQQLIVPMDDAQTNHLKAYGLVYNALRDGHKAEWLLNYRGGSFLLPDVAELRKRSTLDGVRFEPIDGGTLAAVRAQVFPIVMALEMERMSFTFSAAQCVPAVSRTQPSPASAIRKGQPPCNDRCVALQCYARIEKGLP